MAGHGEKLSQRQELAISALLTEPSLLDAAQCARIGVRTLQRWLHAPEHHAFQAAYRAAKKDVVEQAMTRVQRATGQAVETLCAIMTDIEAPASARVSAARAVLETAVRTVEVEDLETRIAALEARGGGNKP